MKTEHLHKLSNDELRNLLETRPEYTSQAVPVLLSRLPNDADDLDDLDDLLDETGRESVAQLKDDLAQLDKALDHLDAESPRELLFQIEKF